MQGQDQARGLKVVELAPGEFIENVQRAPGGVVGHAVERPRVRYQPQSTPEVISPKELICAFVMGSSRMLSKT